MTDAEKIAALRDAVQLMQPLFADLETLFKQMDDPRVTPLACLGMQFAQIACEAVLERTK